MFVLDYLVTGIPGIKVESATGMQKTLALNSAYLKHCTQPDL